MKKIISIICVLFALATTQAQEKKKNAKISLEVDGVCMMCKKRIEKAALNLKGVKFANWNVNSHELTVIMDERKTSEQLICEGMAKVGHDTKIVKATQEAYDNLHPCCKYRNDEILENHKQ